MGKELNSTPDAIAAKSHLLGSMEMNRLVMEARQGGLTSGLSVANVDSVDRQAIADIRSEDRQIG